MRRFSGTYNQEVRRTPLPSALIGADPRILICIWAGYTLGLISVPRYDLAGALAFAAFPLFAAIWTGAPVLAILKRVGLLSPFVLLMAAANPFFDRAPFLTVSGIAISSGTVSGGVIVIKGVLSIATVLALMWVVPFDRVCVALRDMHVPEPFVTQVALLYRYALLLGEEALALRKARDLRAFGRKGRGLSTTAKLIGSLLLRAVERAGRVHKAMLARGFSGRLHHASPSRLRPSDLVLLGAALSAFLCVRVVF